VPWVEVHGNDLYYVEDGDPAAPPLVFLHGNSSCGEAWWQQFEAFRDRFHVLAYDSVNHGHSSNSPRDAEETDRADELEGFLTALGIERPVIAGNSMGGNTLIRWATRHPTEARGLIPSGSGVRPAGQGMPPARDPLDVDTLFLPIGDSLTDGFKAAHPRMHERYLRIRSTATRLEALRHPRRPAARTVEERDSLADRVGQIESPMLVVVGSLDRAEPAARRLHELVEHSSLTVIEGAPHNVYYEAAEPYNAAVGAFLEQLAAAPVGAAGD
jgi:pimeloyl-ACP methyl ester carboxylesterase